MDHIARKYVGPCQVRNEIRPLYGRFAPTDGERSHAMNGPVNYDPGSGKIPPESGNAMAVLDFACDVDSESGGPSLRHGRFR